MRKQSKTKEIIAKIGILAGAIASAPKLTASACTNGSAGNTCGGVYWMRWV